MTIFEQYVPQKEIIITGISVKDRLPEIGERVLCGTYLGTQICHMNLHGKFVISCTGVEVDVDYWLPLPFFGRVNAE